MKNISLYIYSERESFSVVSDSLRPHWLCSPLNSPGQNTGVGSLSLLQGIFPTQRLNPSLLHCGQIQLPAELQGKPKNTGMGSLSLLQGIFSTQELNQGLLHWRQIFYQLSYQGSPLMANSMQFKKFLISFFLISLWTPSLLTRCFYGILNSHVIAVIV